MEKRILLEVLNFHLGMAKNDYLYAKSGMSVSKELGNYNVASALCSQSGEKYLKAVIEKCFVGDADAVELLHSHNLRVLYNKIIIKFPLNRQNRILDLHK